MSRWRGEHARRCWEKTGREHWYRKQPTADTTHVKCGGFAQSRHQNKSQYTARASGVIIGLFTTLNRSGRTMGRYRPHARQRNLSSRHDHRTRSAFDQPLTLATDAPRHPAHVHVGAPRHQLDVLGMPCTGAYSCERGNELMTAIVAVTVTSDDEKCFWQASCSAPSARKARRVTPSERLPKPRADLNSHQATLVQGVHVGTCSYMYIT